MRIFADENLMCSTLFGYISQPFPLECLDKLDGIEVYNSGNDPEWNESARKLAEERGLACVAGSDGHSVPSAGRSGIAVGERISSNEDLIRILKSGEYSIFVNE